MDKSMSRRQLVAGAAGTTAAAAAASVAAQAGVALADGESWMPSKWDIETEVLVAGFGAAGSAAAITAADAGAKVLLIEKAPEGEEGGNVSVCAGSIDLGFHGGTSMTEEEFRYNTIFTWSDEDIQKVLDVEHDLDNFLIGIGANITSGNDTSASYRDGWTYDADPTGEVTTNNGWCLFDDLKAAVLERSANIEVRYETPIIDLVQDPVSREVLGAVAGSKEEPIYIKATKGVLLCCGDYAGNNEVMSDIFLPGVVIPSLGTPYNTGDALRMCMKAGVRCTKFALCNEWHNACITAPSLDYGTAICLGQGLGNPNPFDTAYVFVNKDGKRFINEFGNILHSKTYPIPWFEFYGPYGVATEEQGYINLPAFMIFDQKEFESGPFARRYGQGGWGWNSGHPTKHHVYEWSDDNSAELEAGYIFKADTLEELAEEALAFDWTGRAVNIDPEGLVATIEAYNALCDSGEDDPEFGRSADTLKPVLEPPFYAMEVGPSTLYSVGGPSVNVDSQAVDFDGEPIPRLFVCGNAGSPFVLRTCAVHGSITMGRIAAAAATASEPWA